MSRTKISATLSLCLLLFVFASAVYAAPVKLTFSGHHGPKDVHSQLIEQWIKEVEQRTNGKVDIEFFPGQSKISAPQTYNGVSHGFVDIGFSVMQYTRGRFPLMDFITLPLGYSNAKANTAILNEVYEKFQPAEFDNVKVLYLHAPGPGYLHTKGAPIRTLNDFKGKKIRSSGTTAEMIELLGGTPVSQPMPKLYNALVEGVIQGGMWDYSASVDWKLAEAIDNDIVCEPIAYSLGFFVIMNKEKWESLDSDVRSVMEQLGPTWAAKHGAAWDEADERGLAYTRRLDKNIVKIEGAEAAKWQEKVKPVIDDYINNTVSRGLPGKEVLEYVNKRLADARAGKFRSKFMQ